MIRLAPMATRIAISFLAYGAKGYRDELHEAQVSASQEFCSALGFLRGNLCALFARLGKPNGNRLFPAFHPAASTRPSRTQRPVFLPVHRAPY